jgi:EF-hand domain
MKANDLSRPRAGKKNRVSAAPPLVDFEWRSVLLMACLSACVMAGAHAQPAAQTPARMLEAGATETLRQPTAAPGDGSPGNVSAQRGNAKSLDAAFRRADRDSDGRLSRQESEHFPALAQQFEQFDNNRDDFISRDEFNRAANQ